MSERNRLWPALVHIRDILDYEGLADVPSLQVAARIEDVVLPLLAEGGPTP